MKKIFSLFLLLSGAGAIQAQQLSPQTEIYLKRAAGQELPILGYVYRGDATHGWYLPALVMTDGQVKASTLEAQGIRVHTQAGNIWTVAFPAHRFPAMARNLPGIRYIELDAPLAPTMDAARSATRVDSAQQGIGLPKGYTGDGVVAGILDVGFDYTHPAFYDTTGQRYRIRRIWEQKAPSGTPPAGYTYGRELTDTALMVAAVTDRPDNTHGTHVAGIAAGSGRGAGDTTQRLYRGVAYAADLVLVGITPASSSWTSTAMSDIIDGMNYVYTYAASVQKPAVVNLSWGCPVGPHDGNSLFSQACDNLTGPGKAFVLSAGNNGQNSIHTQKLFTATDSLLQTVFTFPVTPIGRRSWIDIWGIENQNLSVQLSLYDSTTAVVSDTTAWIPLTAGTQSIALIGTDGDTLQGYVSPQVAVYNNKPRILLDLQSNTRGRLHIAVKGTPGLAHVWAGYVHDTRGYYGNFNTGNLPGRTAGNASFTVSDMVTTQSALAVAAYNTKVIYTSVDTIVTDYRASGYTAGRIAPFSSRGPATNGTNKPDIAAPGMVIIAPLNTTDTTFVMGGSSRSSTVTEWTAPGGTTYRYGALMGTSMSSPVVAGIVALLLEADPTLRPERIRELLQQTAIRDQYTGNIPATGSPIWGAGKVNAYAALQQTLSSLGIAGTFSNPNQLPVLLYPNPGNGQLVLEYESPVSGKAMVQLTDALGRLLYQKEWLLQTGHNQMLPAVPGLAPGIYFLQLHTPSGKAGFRYLRQ